ncbi:hypothetical protein ParaMal1_00045 [Paracoccus phage ParMal1]|uniref:Uncharacterized protein n=1 Tax=Paracoccus phage ParMal1 TaxID=3032416 RepID=A0AAF0JI12_9CAUD|nr:hypothetical protein ParaMal1_00045 [Paracoccus phage ParMal1]
MSELTSITGKALIDRQVMIQLLAALEPNELDENSHQYHIGYERAKADLLAILARTLGPEFAASASTRLIKELRRDKGA